MCMLAFASEVIHAELVQGIPSATSASQNGATTGCSLGSSGTLTLSGSGSAGDTTIN